ncbi:MULTISPECIES: DegV family protein [unclassified Neisseria]|uniref:DegV family protein n=1 Tax=unclassified Neisseria TaxID=2623750 RepID=UPI002665AC5D|nr:MULTISPECIES: DegV family protein [unclassified Neisseria]MDO1509669.1 DegV family protein [Neisseria sp. MVDL19-042950]MDO1516007.1 DegV family protein [Neisseria sp. MVDL18-041461]MDO1563120.1 DegV family protein [Neisseria sp. MVDL20-010259]
MPQSYSFYRCAVLATSTSALDNVVDRDSPIHILRPTVHLDGREYADWLDLKPEEFHEWLLSHPAEEASTSPPSPESLRNTFNYLKTQGYHEAIVTTVSGKVSQTAAIVREIAEEMVHDLKIYVVDTGMICMPEGFFAFEAVRLLKEGKTPEEVVEYLEKLKPRCQVLLGLQSLKQLTRTGTLERLGASFNDWLGLKNILRFSQSGVSRVTTVPDSEDMIDSLVETVADTIKDINPADLVICGSYCGRRELYQQFTQKLHQKTGLHLECGKPVSPAVGVHLGENAIGVGIVERLPA